MNRYIDSEIILTRKIKYIVYVYVMIIIIMLLSLIIAFMLLDYKTYLMIRKVFNNNLKTKLYFSFNYTNSEKLSVCRQPFSI